MFACYKHVAFVGKTPLFQRKMFSTEIILKKIISTKNIFLRLACMESKKNISYTFIHQINL
jgi:hypothetical protein